MKKTLITLAALAMASSAFAAETMTANGWGNYEVADGVTYDASTYVTPTPRPSQSPTATNSSPYVIFAEGASVTFELTSGEITFACVEAKTGTTTLKKTGDGTLIIDSSNGAPSSVVVDDGTLKIADNSNQRYAFNFTMNNGGTLDVSGADQIYANSITLNSGSTFIFGATAINLDDATSTLTLGSNVTLDLSAWGTSSDAFADGTTLFTSVSGLTSSTQVTLDFGNGDMGFYSLSLSDGGGVTAKAVPEPATATLSLLALAGLAARRRRK